MAWQKGQSGNPSGRPKSIGGLRELLKRKYGQNAEKLVAKLDELSRSQDPRVALAAVKLMMAYQVGAPLQRMEMSGNAAEPLEIVLSDATTPPPDPEPSV